MSDTATTLRKARDHIAQPGMWWQGGGFALSGVAGAIEGEPCCAWGAIIRVVGAANDKPAVNLLNEILTDAGEERLGSWNDTPGRTQAEVVALFDRAIDLAEREATA